MTGSGRRGLPVVVIGGGPVGLAAAAHLRGRGLPTLVLEAGAEVGAAVRQWAHVRTFTPWRYVIDSAAEKLLAPTGWAAPAGDLPPTGAEIVAHYLEPLAAALGPGVVRTGARVLGVARAGLDKARSVGRDARPFAVRVAGADGVRDVLARAVVDASGVWGRPNPLGASGLPAIGEPEAAAFMVGALPDVRAGGRARFAGRTTLVAGMGHSAANTLLDLADLAAVERRTRVVWAIRGDSPDRLYGGGDADQLAARGELGAAVRALVESGRVRLLTAFSVAAVEVDGDTVCVLSSDGRRVDGVHNVAAATGFRPDLAILGEVRLDLDPGLEAPRRLAPMIDPAFHSCGSVPPHGYRELAHPEQGLFIVGAKSYGRAPTFLITTGNEQVRSVAAHLAGDDVTAGEVHLVLPETGVCSTRVAPRTEGR